MGPFLRFVYRGISSFNHKQRTVGDYLYDLSYILNSQLPDGKEDGSAISDFLSYVGDIFAGPHRSAVGVEAYVFPRFDNADGVSVKARVVDQE